MGLVHAVRREVFFDPSSCSPSLLVYCRVFRKATSALRLSAERCAVLLMLDIGGGVRIIYAHANRLRTMDHEKTFIKG